MLVDMTQPMLSERVLPQSAPYRTVALYGVVVMAQLLDLLTFVPAVAKVGIGAESNPLARLLYASVGAFGPAGLKIVAISIIFVAMARVARRFPKFVWPSAAVVVAIGLFGAGSNIAFGLMR